MITNAFGPFGSDLSGIFKERYNKSLADKKKELLDSENPTEAAKKEVVIVDTKNRLFRIFHMAFPENKANYDAAKEIINNKS